MSLLKELLLIEADKKKPTKVATKSAEPKLNNDDIFGAEFHSPAASNANKSVADKQRQGGSLRAAIAAASQGGTQAPAMNHAAMADLPNDDDEMDTDVDYGRPEPSPPEDTQALATVSKDVRAAGTSNPDWMTIDQLPGYMQTGIRRMGRVVFAPLTKTKMQKINILANLGGHGPNSKLELNSVAKWAQDHAHETRDLAMTFGDMIPGYEPDAKLYVTPNDTYLVVQDEMGQYIYSWESKDTKDAFVKSIEGGDGPTKSLE